MKKFFKEFKDFVCRGNIFDMAVGMIIATAFNKIVSSLVNDIIMPLITSPERKVSTPRLLIKSHDVSPTVKPTHMQRS